MVIHIPENAAKEVRGMNVSLINVMIFIGITISATVIITVTYETDDPFNSDRVLGIIGLILATISVVCTIFLDRESVAYLLVRNKEDEALECMKCLRSETNETWQVTEDVEEMHRMVKEDEKDGKNIFTEGNARPLASMTILYFLAVLTNNYLMNIILFNFLSIAIGWENYMYAPLILASVRAVIGILSIFFSDIVGRKIHLTVTGVTLFIVIVITIIIFFVDLHFWLLGSFAILFQLFVAIGIDPIQHVYLSEAFSTSKKSFSIAFVMVAENSLQIVFISLYYVDVISSANIFVLVASCIFGVCIFVVILMLILPETMGTSLKEARDEFRDNDYKRHCCSGFDGFNCCGCGRHED